MNEDMFYVDYDEETDMFCVFAYDDKTPFAYSTWHDKEMAQESADSLNRNYKIVIGRKR